MEAWFRLPQAVRGILYAAAGFTFALLAFLAWDFGHLAVAYAGNRVTGWAVLAALVGLLGTQPSESD